MPYAARVRAAGRETWPEIKVQAGSRYFREEGVGTLLPTAARRGQAYTVTV